MRFFTIPAAVLLGSAVAAVNAQQIQSANNPAPTKSASKTPTKSSFAAAAPTQGLPGSLPLVSGATESCVGATAIAGAGLFVGDNLGAADLEEADTPCRSGTNEANDVWYEWTSTATGNWTASMCPAGGGVTDFDTVLTIYDGAGCVGPVVNCNDDACAGFGSEVVFPATSGNVYKVQICGWATAEEGTFSLNFTAPAPPPANDLCAAATAIAGPGFYPGTTAGAATDGVIGTCPNALNDVWYDWTATFTAPTDVSFCAPDGGAAAFDTVLYAYDTAACVGPQNACNDDFCGLQSKVNIAATAGNTYKLRVGQFGATGGAFTMAILATPPAPPNDSCATPDVYVSGVAPWSNVGATLDGAAESCGNPSPDIWYVWNASCTGVATFSLCPGGLLPDTVIAAYAGAGCPVAGTAIGCDDDTCSSPAFGTSQATFCVTAGANYMLRIGGFGGTTGSGLFEVTCGPNPTPVGTCAVYHDGQTETAVGLNDPNADVLWIHSMGVTGQQTIVKSISTAWGTAIAPAVGPPNGAPCRVGIWSDPNQDGDPSDAVNLQEVLTTVVGTGTDALQSISLTPPVLVSGKYFIGASCQNATFPAPLDESASDPCNGTAWIAAQVGGGLIDYNNMGASAIPPSEINGLGLPGFWLLEAECKDLSITPICGVQNPGDCPCGNDGGVGNGCANSAAPGGANLSGTGDAIINADTVQVLAVDIRRGNPTLALFFSGSETPQNAVNDGLLCGAGSPICRLWTWKIPGPGGGVIALGGPGPNTIPPNVGIAQRSADMGRPILNGETRVYTVWYRDPPTFGCAFPATSNYTNGLRILWSSF